MLIRGETFRGGGRIPYVTDIKVACPMLQCDFDIGRASARGAEGAKHGFPASRQVLFGQRSELLAHVIQGVLQREFRQLWISFDGWGVAWQAGRVNTVVRLM